MPAVAEPIHRPFTLAKLNNSSRENIVGNRSRTITNNDERHDGPVVRDNNQRRVARVTTVKLFKFEIRVRLVQEIRHPLHTG